MRLIDNKTLIISNHIFEKLGCGALCYKAYIYKDKDSKLYIKANSLLTDNVNDFIQPRFEYWEHKNENINHQIILDNIKLDNEIRVYVPLSIKSLLGNDMVVTLKDGILWNELVCYAVEINKPNVKVIILTIHNEGDYLLSAYEKGADGYVLKDSGCEVLKSAIRTVTRGEQYIEPILMPKLRERLDNKNLLSGKEERLSKREFEILKLVAVGMYNKEIADALSISEKTVKNHMSSIFRKIKVSDRTQAAVYAIRNNYVKLD